MNLAGIFDYRRNRGPWRRLRNLITTEGWTYLVANNLTTGVFGALEPVLYLALFGSDVVPVDTWTAATFAATAGEIGDAPEGYVEAARPTWVPSEIGVDVTNFLNPAEFNIRTATQLQVCGFGVLTDNTKSGTSGTLISAVRFTDAPVLFDNHDILDVRWTLTPIQP